MKINKFFHVFLVLSFLFTLTIEAKKTHEQISCKDDCAIDSEYQSGISKKNNKQIEFNAPQEIANSTDLPIAKVDQITTDPIVPPFLIKVAAGYGVYYLTSFYTTLAHEYGHAIAAKLLFGVNSTISLFPKLVGVEGYAAYHGGIPAKGLKSAAVSAAGPIFGMATGYGILKLYNILSEYFDKSKSIKDAIKDGIKKPLLNADQGLKLQIAVGLTSFDNLCNLLPIIEDNVITDGARILYALT